MYNLHFFLLPPTPHFNCKNLLYIQKMQAIKNLSIVKLGGNANKHNIKVLGVFCTQNTNICVEDLKQVKLFLLKFFTYFLNK